MKRIIMLLLVVGLMGCSFTRKMTVGLSAKAAEKKGMASLEDGDAKYRSEMSFSLFCKGTK